MKEEIDAIERTKIWELVDLPITCDAIGVKWTYMLKYNPDVSVKNTKQGL